ncbi:MAG: hypothetical protein HYY18_23130 [Planctomycetes bacterium]|nr:hypothetical protein [Planctomycetota bacterium]
MAAIRRGGTLGAVAALVSVLAAGCSGNGAKGSKDIPKGFGRLEVDVRRDGGKHAIRFSYVIYPTDRTSEDPKFTIVLEPLKDFPNPYDANDPANRTANVIVANLPPGTYGLDVFGVGACGRVRDLVVKEGDMTAARLNLEPGGAVSGTVLGEASGEPLPGVLVFRPLDRGYGSDPKEWDPKTATEGSRVSRTGDTGSYYIPNLPAGEHLLVFYMPELGWTERTVKVLEGKKLVLNPVAVGAR